MRPLSKFCFLILIFFYHSSLFAQENELQPGIDRWKIKTSAPNFTSNNNAKPVSLKTLLNLPLLDKTYSDKNYPDTFIPKKVGSLHEGDIISTKGYLHLVALEDASNTHRDGDYHIQLTLSPDWGDSCFIVEIPYQDFVSDAQLMSLCDSGRSFIRKELLHDDNKQPTVAGNKMQSQVYVKVTGQLFYDAIHATTMSNQDPSKRKYRGKRGMHSYTAWEIHPVTKIEFAVKPH